MRARTRTTRRKAPDVSRATSLLAFQHLAEKGRDRLEIQATLGISRATYYRLRAALAELREHHQDWGSDDA